MGGAKVDLFTQEADAVGRLLIVRICSSPNSITGLLQRAELVCRVPREDRGFDQEGRDELDALGL